MPPARSARPLYVVRDHVCVEGGGQLHGGNTRLLHAHEVALHGPLERFSFLLGQALLYHLGLLRVVRTQCKP